MGQLNQNVSVKHTNSCLRVWGYNIHMFT